MQKTFAIHNISEYLKALNAWKNHLTVISSNGARVMVKGQWFTKEEFDAHNPMPVYAPKPLDNPDITSLNVGTITRK